MYRNTFLSPYKHVRYCCPVASNIVNALRGTFADNIQASCNRGSGAV